MHLLYLIVRNYFKAESAIAANEGYKRGHQLPVDKQLVASNKQFFLRIFWINLLS